MNDILQLKGTLQERVNDNKPGPRNVPNNAPAINSGQLKPLLRELQSLSKYWKEQNIIKGCLIDVCYTDVIAKSNRISGFFSGSGSVNSSVVGARFADEEKRKHLITHYVSDAVVENTIQKLQGCIKLLDEEFNGVITHDLIESLNNRLFSI
jgi:hypothetical protein